MSDAVERERVRAQLKAEIAEGMRAVAAQAFRKGQESMRERAAVRAYGTARWGHSETELQRQLRVAIRALPIEDPDHG